MEPRDSRAPVWRTYSGLVLALGGVFAVIDGLTAVYKSTFFTSNAVFVFSDLRAWGWITFSVGAIAVVSGFAVFSGREWARWTGIAIAGLGAIGQMLFAQAYPLWSLMIMGVYLLAIYGLAVHGVRDRAADTRTASRYETTTGAPERPSSAPHVGEAGERERRAA